MKVCCTALNSCLIFLCPILQTVCQARCHTCVLSKGVASRDFLLMVYDNYCLAGYHPSQFKLERKLVAQYVPKVDLTLQANLGKSLGFAQRTLGDWTNNCVPAAASVFLPQTAVDPAIARRLLAQAHKDRHPYHGAEPQWYTSSYAAVPVVALSYLLSKSETCAFLVVSSTTGK